MYKPELVLENQTHTIPLDFEIKTDYLIPTRKLDEVIIKKKELASWVFDRSGGPQC